MEMEVRNENPLRKAKFMNKLTFWWLKDIMRRGEKRDLDSSDIYDIMSEDSSEALRPTLEIAWETEKTECKLKSARPSLWRVIIKTYYKPCFKFALFQAFYVINLLTQPELLAKILRYFNSNKESNSTAIEAYIYATTSILLMASSTALSRHGTYRLNRLGMQIKVAFSSLIYKKIAKLPCSSTTCDKSASAVNLLSMDVSNFECLLYSLGHVLMVPVQLLGATYFIYSYVGLMASLTGVIIMVLQIVPAQMIYSKLNVIWRAKQAVNTDNRISLIDEILTGVRLIKMYAWENYFEKLVCHARRLEIQSFLIISYISISVDWLLLIAHRVCSFFVILVYFLQCKLLATAKLLTVRQHFYNMRTYLIVYLDSGLQAITKALVSVRRIEDFLCLPEVKSCVKHIDDQVSSGTILVNNVTACWDETAKNMTLCKISINFLSGRFYTVVGAAGSGKSSLLKLILGELKPTSGEVSVTGEISYASQEPWLFAASVRDNILFGQDYDLDRYNEVVKACALLEDFNNLPRGDRTLVGGRGMSLSGGQRARINLARALYRQADVYLLDDPLSAVDTRVAKILKSQCIDGLLKDKTVILVTHNVHHLGKDDNIVLVKSGEIQFNGKMLDFQKMNEHAEFFPSKDIDCTELIEHFDDQVNTMKADEQNLTKQDEGAPLLEAKEITAEGIISVRVFLKYVKVGGYACLFAAIATHALSTALMFKFDFNMTAWTEQATLKFRNQTCLQNEDDSNKNASFSNLDDITSSTTIISSTYVLVLIIATTILKNIFIYRFGYAASRKLHNGMFASLIRTSMRFFELNPAGRILNRFTEDIGNMDNNLPSSFLFTLEAIFEVIGTLSFVLIINWWSIIPIILISLVFVRISFLYVSAVPKIKRLVGNAYVGLTIIPAWTVGKKMIMTKSPVLNFVTSTLAGLTTIRSCKAENFVMNEFDMRLNKHTAAFFLVLASTMAISLWIEMLSVSLFACAVYICIALKDHGIIGGAAGLILTAITEMFVGMAFLIRGFTETCTHMISVERVLQYNNLEPEDLAQKELIDQISKEWPSKGEIKFERVNLKYSDEADSVLKELRFFIKAGTKVGIVGRTGAGKSSLIAALFRLAKLDGQVLIDDVDTRKADLAQLRSRISIIPQEPILFSASLRSNLDPENEFDDVTLWSALDSVGLKQIFSSLDQLIEKAGKNLSVGQRQLLCLARVTVKNNKILVLDEATANIDTATDAQIQKTIREQFKNCTVLTIAHRLNTIMDNDKVLVMDQGQVVEYDHPHLLLQNREGCFSKMVEQTGEQMAQQLRIIAENAYKDSAAKSTE